VRPRLQWARLYDPRQPFVCPPGLSPQQMQAVNNASYTFRQFDRNFSGVLSLVMPCLEG
jgi:hypothetical protein